MYGCESWTIKKAEHQRIDAFELLMLEKTLESPLDCKEIQPVHPKGNWSWIFIQRADVEAETPILWPPDAKSWLIGKDPDAGKDWGQKEKGTTEDEMVGWHHWLDGHEFEWALRVGDGQGGMVCCGPRGHKESDTTERLNWTELDFFRVILRTLPCLSFPVVALCLTAWRTLDWPAATAHRSQGHGEATCPLRSLDSLTLSVQVS